MVFVRKYLVVLCLLCPVLSVTIVSVTDAKGHGCVSSLPPPVNGPLVQPQAIPDELFLNEVLMNPHSLWNCSSSTTDATNNTWVELYNPQAEALDLYAVHTNLDSGPGTNAYIVPFGTAIAAHGFLALFPLMPGSSMSFQGNATPNLRLLIGNTLIDQVTIPALAPDTSYARVPDGSSTWLTTADPTIATSNATPSITPTASKDTATQETMTSTVSTTRRTATSTARRATPESRPPSTGNNTGSSPTQLPAQDSDQGQTPQTIQPTWGALQFPAATPSPLATVTTTVTPLSGMSTNTGPPPGNPASVGKILLTALALGIALTALGSWRFLAWRKGSRGRQANN